LKGIIVYNSLYTMSFLKLIHHIGRFGFIGTLVLSLLFIFPQKSLAFLGVADVVIDPTNLVQNTVSAVANPVTAAASGITAAMTTAEKIKEYVLDPAARAIVRGIIQRLTAQTVNWINSGFKGNPAYVTDPGQFFLNVGDDVASNFLSSTRLNALCSPFRAQVRVALVKNYLNETSENFSCTLSRVKDNYESFMNDFSQGGWDGWFEVTQNNSNNPYGAYLDYSGALEKAVNAEKNKYDKQLDQGKGFLSYEKCPAGKEVKKCLGTEAQVRVETCPNGKPPFGGTAVRALCDFGVAPTVTWTKQCTGATEDSCKVAKETVTPGSVIESQLENALGSGIRQLELTRSFDEIVSALITQLFTRVVGGGQKDVPNSDSLRGDGRNIIPPPEGVRGGPLIVLLGKDTMEVVLGNKFTDPGASAFDPLDGDISKNVIATGEVDVNILGTYTLRYNVKNSKGISADEVTLIVNVVEPAEPPPGNTTTTPGTGSSGTSTPPAIVNGACGNATDGTFSVAPTTNLCSIGTASNTTGITGNWVWKCIGSGDGHTDTSCSANIGPSITPPPTPATGQVTLSASPSVGTSFSMGPVTLTASNSGSGQFYYYFFCNRNQTDSPLPPVPSGHVNIQVLTSQTTYTSPIKCGYSGPGTYYPKVISLRFLDSAGNPVYTSPDAWRQANATVIIK